MVVKHINPLSMAKVLGVLYAILGLIGGAFFALIATMGGAAGMGEDGGMFGAMFGVGAIVFFPILYGLAGLIGGLICAVLYNVIAGMVGGVEIDVQ